MGISDHAITRTSQKRIVASQGQGMGVLCPKHDLMQRFIIKSLLFQKEMPNILIN